MADTNRVVSETFQASGDMSGLQHRFVDHVGVGIIGHSLANGGIGVLVNKPEAGDFATVALSGRVRVDAGAAVTAGAWIVSAASGFGVSLAFGTINAGSAGQFLQTKIVMGRAMSTAASGSVFTLELMPHNVTVNSA